MGQGMPMVADAGDETFAEAPVAASSGSDAAAPTPVVLHRANRSGRVQFTALDSAKRVAPAERREEPDRVSGADADAEAEPQEQGRGPEPDAEQQEEGTDCEPPPLPKEDSLPICHSSWQQMSMESFGQENLAPTLLSHDHSQPQPAGLKQAEAPAEDSRNVKVAKSALAAAEKARQQAESMKTFFAKQRAEVYHMHAELVDKQRRGAVTPFGFIEVRQYHWSDGPLEELLGSSKCPTFSVLKAGRGLGMCSVKDFETAKRRRTGPSVLGCKGDPGDVNFAEEAPPCVPHQAWFV